MAFVKSMGTFVCYGGVPADGAAAVFWCNFKQKIHYVVGHTTATMCLSYE